MDNLQKVGVSGLIMIGSVAGFTVSGIISAFSDGYFLGRERKKGVTYKNIARRNAALGALVGSIAIGAFLSAKTEEPVQGIRLNGLPARQNRINIY